MWEEVFLCLAVGYVEGLKVVGRNTSGSKHNFHCWKVVQQAVLEYMTKSHLPGNASAKKLAREIEEQD